jgi:Lactonase, 7-bladed beta-propeller
VLPRSDLSDESASDRTILVHPVDPRNLPPTQRVSDGIRCGYVTAERSVTVPGLGSPNVAESSSVYVYDVTTPSAPRRTGHVKPGQLVGELDGDIATYGASHPNSVATTRRHLYVANGNHDSISIFDRHTLAKLRDVDLSIFEGADQHLKGVQPVALRLSPDQRTLYVAEAGINAVGVLAVERGSLEVLGHIPVGWWPSSVDVSADGRTLFVANSKGRGAGPYDDFPLNNIGTPKHSTMGSVSIVPVPRSRELARMSERVFENNGFVSERRAARGHDGPIPSRLGARSRQIKHVIFINKENATQPSLRRHPRDAARCAGGERAALRARSGREPQPPRARAPLHLERQLLPGTESGDRARWSTGRVSRPPDVRGSSVPAEDVLHAEPEQPRDPERAFQRR